MYTVTIYYYCEGGRKRERNGKKGPGIASGRVILVIQADFPSDVEKCAKTLSHCFLLFFKTKVYDTTCMCT